MEKVKFRKSWAVLMAVGALFYYAIYHYFGWNGFGFTILILAVINAYMIKYSVMNNQSP